MKNCHLVLYDKRRAKPPRDMWLANGERVFFLTGSERDEHMLCGLVIGTVIPPLEEWPQPLASLVRSRMQPPI